MFYHETYDTKFTLCVDDFGVQYTNKAHCQHLIDCLDSLYKLTVEWEGTKYLGLTLAWDYRRRTCNVSMPGYVQKALQQYFALSNLLQKLK
jgi:hypothetical protein